MAAKAPAKKTAKKTAKQAPATAEILKTVPIPITDLNPYYRNPRRGNIEVIAKSLHLSGQYRPVVVNIGTYTGRPNEVLAGNHTLFAAEKEITWEENGVEYHKPEWTHLHASFVDVDEERAKTIVVVDNKAADLGTYDEKELAELVADIPVISATGFEFDEARILIENNIDLADIERDTADLLEGIRGVDGVEEGDEPRTGRERYEQERGEEGNEVKAKRGLLKPDETPEEDKDIEDISVAQEMQVLLELKEDTNFISDGKYGIPELLPEMLVESIPDKIQTWAGRNLTPDDGKKTFLYTIGNGSRPGLPFDRTILAFWAFDEKFENWWESPSYFVARYMSAGLRQAVVPDFSYPDLDCKALHLWQSYRAQWIGRFFQEAGMKVIPRLQFSLLDPDPLDVSLNGIPKDVPVLGIECQNYQNEEQIKRGIEIIKEATTQRIDVGTLLLYGSKKRTERIANDVNHKGKTVVVENYISIAKRDRDARTPKGAKALTKKKKQMIMDKHGVQKKDSADVDPDVLDDDEGDTNDNE